MPLPHHAPVLPGTLWGAGRESTCRARVHHSNEPRRSISRRRREGLLKNGWEEKILARSGRTRILACTISPAPAGTGKPNQASARRKPMPLRQAIRLPEKEAPNFNVHRTGPRDYDSNEEVLFPSRHVFSRLICRGESLHRGLPTDRSATGGIYKWLLCCPGAAGR
jgi:hypothetical protein